MMPVHIVRPIGKHERIPAYSTQELMLGVCHIAGIPKPKKQQPMAQRFILDVAWSNIESNLVRLEKSRGKFRENREAIYKMLAEKRGITSIASNFGIGRNALLRFLKEESK